MTEPRHAVVGIDLGTSHSALAHIAAGGWKPALVRIAQLDGPGLVGEHVLLPSVLYVPFEGEIAGRDARLPWQSDGPAPDVIAGRWARERAAMAPERAVTSAKSWLAHPGIEPKAPILPWKSALERGKRSPFEASRLYLTHLREAFFAATAAPKDAPLDLVLTVPASFDEVARNLTHEAAEAAGWARVSLLEEPLAALYAWIAASDEQWRQDLRAGDLILVCDVGGGTTDLSLIAATEAGGELKLERLSVGDHLLLGGDNMDLALAHALRAKLAAAGAGVDHWQFQSLVAVARDAKEKLFSDPALRAVPVAVAGRGSSLFASSLATSLGRDEAERLIIDGFFPLTGPAELPKPRRGVGIQELGLNFEAEPAVSRHLARFLAKSRQNAESRPELHALVEGRLAALAPGAPLLPTAVLFNGGVFNANALRERVLSLLAAWNGGAPVRELRHEGVSFDLAVAQGAAYYGQIRQSGDGIRIRAGTAHSYYIGVDSPMPAVPGYEPPVRGLCVVPQGTEEGSDIPFDGREFGVVVGEPVEFRFFSSSARAGDAVGATVDDAAAELAETARLATTLAPAAGTRAGDVVPVRLEAAVTAVGTLQLFLRQAGGAHKWQLEFSVRAEGMA